MDRIGIAVIGAGFIADYHLTGLAAVPRAETRVIASRTLAKAQALADRHGVPIATDDVKGALARSDIDAVIITTPDENHEEHAILAARANKAILLQKPMSTTSISCSRIISAAAKAKVDLQVSFMHRYFEEVAEAARQLLASQAIGTVTSVRIRNATPGPDWNDWFFRRDCVSGGAVLQLGIHGIDLIEYLIGSIATVGARTATLQPRRKLIDGRTIDVENPDSAWCIYDLAGGAVASHEVSMIEIKGCDRFRLEIYGSEGTLCGCAASAGGSRYTAPGFGRVAIGMFPSCPMQFRGSVSTSAGSMVSRATLLAKRQPPPACAVCLSPKRSCDPPPETVAASRSSKPGSGCLHEVQKNASSF